MPDHSASANAVADTAADRITARIAGRGEVAAQLDLTPTANPADALLDTVARQIGEPVLSGRSLGGGSTSRTYAVSTVDHEFVVKTNADVSVLARGEQSRSSCRHRNSGARRRGLRRFAR